MTIIYHQNIRNTYLASGIMLPLSNGQSVASSRVASITFYSGSQPTAVQIESAWTNYNSSYLFHLPNFSIQQPNATITGTGIVIVNFGLPTPQTAINTGVATWAILWMKNILAGTAAGQIGSTTLPYTKFVILPISDLSQIYPVRLVDTSIVSGSVYNIADLNILANGGIA